MEFRRIREIKESVKSEKEKLSDTQYWLKFLQTSSYHYKHSFNDQIMINLQNPQFTACSDARSWRSLSREPQGHGVPTLHNGKIRYLFDITQTSAPKGTSLPWVWEINDSQLNIDYSESVSKHLTEKYNLDSETLEEQLYDITLMRTAKYLNDDKSDLYKVVAESAAYSILYRCCPGEAQPSPKNLTGLSKYPIEEIGQAVTEISKSIFLEIESIVRNTRHNAIEEIRRNEHNETRENDRRSETRSESQDRGISSGYGNLKGMDVRFGRGEFPVLSDLSEGSSYRSDIGSGKERISGNGSGIGKTIGGGKRDSGIHGSGVRHSTGRNERELLQDGIGVLKPIPEELLQEIPHGKYVTMRRNYLLNQDPKEFIWLKNSDQLNKHLTAVNLQAHEMEDMIVEKLKENSQEYKEAENQGDYLKTVQLKNSFLKTAEEEILTELIYK